MSAPLTADASNATAPPGGWLGSLTIAIAAFLLFLLLPQRTLHGVDGNQFVVWIEEGHLDYARHVGYLHFCGFMHRILVAFGHCRSVFANGGSSLPKRSRWCASRADLP